MRAKGMDPTDKVSRALVTNNTGVALNRLAQKDLIRRVLTEPEVWWGLAG